MRETGHEEARHDCSRHVCVGTGIGWMSAGSESARAVRPVLSMVLEPSRSDGIVAVGVVEPRYKTNLAFRVWDV